MIWQRYFFLSFLFIPFTSLAQESSDAIKWETYERDKFTVNYPSNWELNALGGRFYSFFIYSPKSSEDDAVLEMVQLQVSGLSNLGDNVTLEGAVKFFNDKRKFFVSVKEESWTEKGGHPCYEVIYTVGSGEKKQKMKEYRWVKDNTIYLLSFEALETTFDEYLPIGGKIINSFSLK